jgi:catechol 2,3-dioxygenase-like lactoylglutathione lyase family enzyme
MAVIRRFDHVGITVADLDAVSDFFVALGFEVEGRMFLQGEFIDTVIGIPDSRTEMVMLKPPDDGTRLEVTRFIHPDHTPGTPDAMATRLGISNVSFEVAGLQSLVDRLAADGYGLIHPRTGGHHRQPRRTNRLRARGGPARRGPMQPSRRRTP